MLSTIREKTQGIFAFIVVGLLTIPFALWGINSYFEGNSNPPIAKVNGVEISKQEFDVAYRGQINRMRGRVDPKVLNSGFIKDQVLNTMISELVFTENARDAGYTLSNQQVNGLIRNQPEFQNVGKFDSERFQAILRANGLSEEALKREMRYVKIQDQILSGYKFSAIVTSSELDELIRLQQQQRKISYLLLKPAYLRSKVKVSEQEIKQHYDRNRTRYQTKDQVRAEYVVLSMDKLIARQNITDKEVRAEYERNIAQYQTAPIRRASHILVELASDASETEEKTATRRIQEIRKQLTAGKSFAALAKKHSDDPLTGRKGGDLGIVKPGTLPSRDLENAIIRLKAGATSEPIRTKYGLHVLKLTSYKPSKTKSFSSLKESIAKTLKTRRGEAVFDEYRERLESLVYEHSDSLQPAAQDVGLKVEASGWLSRRGGTGIFANTGLVNAAFSLQVRQQKLNSDLIETKRNVLVALRLKEDRPAKAKSLTSVRQEIHGQILRQKLELAARDVGEEMLQQARSGKSLASIAAGKAGVQYFKPVWVKRAELLKPGRIKIERAITSAAFAATKPGKSKPALGGVEIASKGFAIYQLHDIKQGRVDTSDKKAREQAKNLLTQRRGSGYYNDQLISLRKQADVTTNKDQLLPQQ